MAGPLFKLVGVLGIDATQFDAGIAKAKTSVGGFGTAAKAGFAIGGAAAAVGFGLMTKGALEMEGAQGKFQAATGKSRDEAVAFSKDMNGLVGNSATVGRSFEDIAAAGTGVAQQFGLTGKAGTDLTQDFLAFSKVTRQDALGAVNDFDAALDAFGEPAARATGLMDQLVASNQKYGTDAGPAAVSALAAMAAPLKAMNMGLDEGVGWLNLMESAGIDAAKGPAALTKALGALKPGEDINDIIAQLGAIEDQGLRTAAATEIFGSKLGPQLANAIQPGMKSIAEFGVTLEDTAGSVDTASDAMLTTTGTIQMYAERVGGALRGIGQEFGPLVTGFASLASLAGPMMGALSTLLGPAAKAVVEKGGDILGKLFGDSFGESVASTTTGATGTIIGNLSGNLIQAVTTSWDRVDAWLHRGTSGLIIAKVGAVSGTIYAGAVAVSGALAGALTTMWSAVVGSRVVVAAVDAAGRVLGSRFGLAFKLAAVIGIAEIASELDKPASDAGHDLGRSFFGAFGDESKGLLHGTVLDSLGDVLHEMWGAHDPAAAGAAGLRDADAYVGTFAGGVTSSGSWADSARTGAATWNSAFRAEYEQGNRDLATALTIGKVLKQLMLEAHKEAAWGGAQTPREFSQGVRSSFDTVKDAFGALRQLMKDTLSPTKKIAELEGIATARLLARGLRSGKPEVRGEAQQIALDTLAELHKLAPGSKAIGTLTTKLLANALPNEKAALQDAINAIVGVVKQPLNNLPGIAENTGESIGRSLARGLNAMRPIVRTAADGLARIVTNHLQLDSPAKEGTWSKRGGPMARLFSSGKKLGMSLMDGLGATAGSLSFMASRIAEAATPGVGLTSAPGLAFAPGLAVAGGAGFTVVVNINGPVNGLTGLRELHDNIERAVRQGVRGANRQSGR